MPELPQKLKKDAIVEAIWEVRFESEEIPELVVGKLAGSQRWSSYKKKRLPASNVPAPARDQDPTLRIQPTLELRSADDSRLIKLGSNVFSYHILAPYCGGPIFKEELQYAVKFVFQALENFSATRFGFRYINAVNDLHHFIGSVTDLSLSITVADEFLAPPFNLNYRRTRGASHISTVRIASHEFVKIPNDRIPLTALIDVDVSTPEDFNTNDYEEAISWIADAHVYEKEEFFRLLPKSIIDKLKEE